MSKKPPLYTGSQFKDLRKSINLSVYKLSKDSNVSEITIYNFEKGKEIKISTYLKLLTALETLKSNDNV